MPDPEFTPTVDQAKRAYVTGMRQAFIASAGEHAEEFDRFFTAIRDAALDEAAEVAESIRMDREAGIVGFFGACDGIASAIRALKEEKK